MICKNCKFKTWMDYNKENQCHVCPDCGAEDYDEDVISEVSE